jgi:hypothetical protein
MIYAHMQKVVTKYVSQNTLNIKGDFNSSV